MAFSAQSGWMGRFKKKKPEEEIINQSIDLNKNIPQLQTQVNKLKQAPPEVPSNKVETVIDPKTGERTITVGGKTYKQSREKAEAMIPSNQTGFPQAGIPIPQDANSKALALALNQNRPGTPMAAPYQLDIQAQQQEQTAKEMQRIGQLPPQGVLPEGWNAGELGAQGVANIALGATAGGAITAGMLSAIGAGAAAGSVVPGIGTAIGATVAAIGVIIGKMSAGKRMTAKDAYAKYTGAKGEMAIIIDGLNKGALTQSQAIDMWNFELSQIREAKAILKKETSNNIESFLSNGEIKLTNIETWERGYIVHEAAFRTALQNPNNVAATYMMPTEQVEQGWFS